MSHPTQPNPQSRGVLMAVAGMCLAFVGCAVVMDLDFGKYRPAEDPPPDVVGGTGGDPVDASPDVELDAEEDTSAESGSGGTGPEDARSEPEAGPSCDDGIQNQGETGIDCGGPCPPCPGFTHFETFDTFPTPGPDGPYSVYGTCSSDDYVDGWSLTSQPDSAFPLGTGYYAIINTTGLLYTGLLCDDKLATPELSANNSKKVTISFDTTFMMLTSSHAEVVLVRDGAPQVVWSKYTDFPSQRVTISDLPIVGISTVEVLFRYVGEFDGYWMIDNIAVVGQ